MLKEITLQQIEAEIQPGYRPPAIDTGITMIPLSALGDREFELLTYMLVKNEIASGMHPGISKIALMPGTSDRGRDCIIYSNDAICGLIQCKKYTGKLTKPQILKEIIKFALFSILDPKIVPDLDKFEYNLYVSNDLTEPALTLIYSYKTEIFNEISSGKIKEYTTNVIDDYESFSKYRGAVPDAQVEDILKRITVTLSNATDLSLRIYNQDQVLKTFFKVTTVASIQDVETIMRKVFDDHGLKLLTDDDIKNFQQRITEVHDTHRINLGFVDFFGFSIDFFRYMKGDQLRDILRQAAALNTSLNIKIMEFIQSEIMKQIFEKITLNLLYTGKIHPFSVNIAAPYLFRRLSLNMATLGISDGFAKKLYPEATMTKDELINSISKYIFDTSAQIMQGNYSSLVGDQEMVVFKKQLYNHIHSGFSTIDDAKERFLLDIEFIKPVLDDIEEIISPLLSKTRTILIKDSSYLEDKSQFDRVLKTVNAIEAE